jgi:hypothetical protein
MMWVGPPSGLGPGWIACCLHAAIGLREAVLGDVEAGEAQPRLD